MIYGKTIPQRPTDWREHKAYDFETDEWTEYEIFAIDGMTDQSEIDKAGYAEDALIGCANEYSEIELNPIDIHRF